MKPTPIRWTDFTDPLLSTLHNIISFLPRLLVAVLLFLLFYGLAILSRHITRSSLRRIPAMPWAVRALIARTVYFFTLAIGVLAALSAANVNVTTLITSLGLAGFALGFALKDILENFISGILLLFARPFEIDDQVILGTFEGTVVNIEIRTTTLRTYNNELVVIPNSRVYTNPVVNHTKLGRRRYQAAFDTSLTADIEMVTREALQATAENPDILTEPAPAIRLHQVDGSADILHWAVFYWAGPTKATETQTLSDTLARLKQRLYDAGVPTPQASSATVVEMKAVKHPDD